MALAPGEARKDLSADALFGSLRSRFASLPDPRSGEVEIPVLEQWIARTIQSYAPAWVPFLPSGGRPVSQSRGPHAARKSHDSVRAVAGKHGQGPHRTRTGRYPFTGGRALFRQPRSFSAIMPCCFGGFSVIFPSFVWR